MKYAAWLWHRTQGIRLNMAVRIAVGIGQVALGLLMVWLSRRLIDETIRTGTTDEVLAMVAWLMLTIVGGVVLRQVYFYMTLTAGTRQSNALRLRIFQRLFHGRLFTGETLHSGDVASRLSKDIEQVTTATADTLPQMVVTGIQLCGAFLLMRWFDKRLAWVLLLLTPAAIVFGKLIARRLRQMTLDIRQDESHIQMLVQESVEHNAVLRSLGCEALLTEKLDTTQEQLMHHVARRTRFTAATRLIMGCTFGLGYLLAFVWGGLGLRNGTISFGVMTSTLQLVGMIQLPVLQLLGMVPSVVHATASIDRLDEASEPGGGASGLALDPGLGQTAWGHNPPGVRFRNVSFSYADSKRHIVEGFSHDFKPGSKTAIMGETGVGKTTLFRLILGLVEPTEGQVEAGGSVGFVAQGNSLMSGTIRQNLLLAKPDATDDELRAALHTACADFVADLPDGIDTRLGERGHGLSEGQAQRIAIARGLLHGGDILLLDEISSSLDEQTEQELYRRLFDAQADRTILLITHRRVIGDLCSETVELGHEQ